MVLLLTAAAVGHLIQAVIIRVLPVIQAPVRAAAQAAVSAVSAAAASAVAVPAESGKVFDNNIM